MKIKLKFLVLLVVVSNITYGKQYVKKFDEARDRDLIFSISNSLLNDLYNSLTLNQLKKSTGITIKVENTYANVAKSINRVKGKEIIIST